MSSCRLGSCFPVVFLVRLGCTLEAGFTQTCCFTLHHVCSFYPLASLPPRWGCCRLHQREAICSRHCLRILDAYQVFLSSTCDPINPFCHSPGYLLASVVSPGILISPERLASSLTSRFGGSPSAYAIKQLGAASFEFKVASADIASEITLRGRVSSGCIQIALSSFQLSSFSCQIRRIEPFRGDKLMQPKLNQNLILIVNRPSSLK